MEDTLMKLNKKWIAVLLLVVMAVALTACGGEKKEEAAKPTIVGVWKMDIKDVLKEINMTQEEYDTMKQFMENMAASIGGTVEFTADGKWVKTISSGMGIPADADSGVYKVEGDKLTLDEQETATFKIEGNTLTISTDPAMVLTR